MAEALPSYGPRLHLQVLAMIRSDVLKRAGAAILGLALFLAAPHLRYFGDMLMVTPAHAQMVSQQ